MSFYRSVLAAVAAIALTSPVFADDASNNPNAQNANDQGTAVAQQLADNAGATTDQNAQSATTQQTANAADSSKVNLNSATAKDLMKVKGVNAAKARAIVAYRKKHGDFKTIDDLSKVKGLSRLKPSKLKAIENQVSID